MSQAIFRYLGHFATFAYNVMSRPEITFEMNETSQDYTENREEERSQGRIMISFFLGRNR